MNKNNNTFLGTDMQKYLKIMLKVLVLAFIALGFFVAYKIAIFFLPFIIAWIVALIIEPLIKFFMKFFKFKRKAACIISFIIIVAIIGSLLFLIISKLTSELTNLVTNFNEEYLYLSNNIKNFVTQLTLPDNINNLAQESLTSIFESSKTWIFSFFSNLTKSLTSLPDFITAFIITILATVFISFDKDFVKNQIRKQVPSSWINKIKTFINDFGRVSINYIKAQGKLALLCFIFVLIALFIVQLIGFEINYLITMCIAIAFIDVLPIFGAGTVMIPWAIYIFYIGNIPLAIIILAIWAVWTIIRKIIEPKILSSQIGLHPIFTLIGMYAGYKISGIIGLILGPLILIVLINAFKELLDKGILKSFFELD